jgi:hypothetical protein
MQDAPPRLSRSTAARQDTLRLEGLPERIQHMIAHVLQHQDLLTSYPIGMLELHFHRASVKVKIVLHPQD